MIIAHAITIAGHKISEGGYEALVKSSESVQNPFTVFRYPAVTPDKVDMYFERFNIKWTWPDSGKSYHEDAKLRMHAYGGPPPRRYACSLSHYLLWRICLENNTPIIVLEHDAKFIRQLDMETIDLILNSEYQMIGLNDPRKNTRLADKFHAVVEASTGPLLPCPVIDNMEIPQGIAGNSAYIIKPGAAEQLIEAVDRYGMWPNDAIACQQLIDGLAVTKTYYTDTQKLRSTTFTDV